jgi:hypothetical protein
MNTINLKDTTLSCSLIGELQKKGLKTKIWNVEGYTTYFYQPHERPKVFFKKTVIGRVESVSCSGCVAFAIEHSKGINLMFGKEKEFISIGRKPKEQK